MRDKDQLLQQALAHIDADATVLLLQRMVQTPSITGNEAAIAELMHEELSRLEPSELALSEFEPGRPNVTAVVAGTGGGPSLLFAGHTDTVHVEGWREQWAGSELEDPFGAVVVDGQMYGRGTGDMKGGNAAVLSALRAIHEAGLRPRGDIMTLFVGDEESGQPGSGLSMGMKAAVEELSAARRPRADFAVYMEPTNLHIYTAQMGFIIAEITVHGKSAYFGTPWLGNDALRAGHRLLSSLYAYTDAIWETADHELLGRPFCLVTEMKSGGYIAVPEKCKLSLIRKVLPSESMDEVKSQLDGLVRRVAINEGIQIDIQYTAGRDHAYGGYPAETDRENSGVIALSEAMIAVTGASNAEVIAGAPFWSEMSFLNNSLGIPSVYFAPGDITNCHTYNECVSVQQLLNGVEIFIRFIANFCGLERI